MFTSTRHIAVVGFRESGKTVFMTSLINHILHHDPKLFFLGNEKEAENVKNHPGENKYLEKTYKIYDPIRIDKSNIHNWEVFQYENQRSLMSDSQNPDWPRRTTDTSVAHLKFKIGRNPKWTKSYELYLYDVPGERIDDFSMLSWSFADWSKKFCEKFFEENDDDDNDESQDELPRNELEFRACIYQFGKALESPNSDEIIRKYKYVIGKGYNTKWRVSTPSIFLLDQKGRRFGTDKKEFKKSGSKNNDELMDKRTSGLPGKEFAPLPDAWFEKPKTSEEYKIVQQFEANYNEYVKKLVKPLAKRLSQCDGMICMVDFVAILINEYQEINRYNGLINTIIEDLKPDNRFHWFSSHIKRLAFVVPKCDLFMDKAVPDPILNKITTKNKIKTILEEITKRLYSNKTRVSAANFVCSAVPSEMPRHFKISDKYFFKKDEWFPDLPEDSEDIPCNFFKDYSKKFHPKWPQNICEVPVQFGMEDIFKYVTNWF